MFAIQDCTQVGIYLGASYLIFVVVMRCITEALNVSFCSGACAFVQHFSVLLEPCIIHDVINKIHIGDCMQCLVCTTMIIISTQWN